MELKNINFSERQAAGAFLRAVLAALLVCSAVPAGSFAAVSTDSIKTDLDALDVLSQRASLGTDKFAQDYMYTGNDRSGALRTRPAVYADPAAAQVPVAKYTAPARVIKVDIKGRVPPLAAAPAALALTVKLGPAFNSVLPAQTSTMAKTAGTEKAAKTSVWQKTKNLFSDAFSAVKTWLTNAKTWLHDKIMGKGRPLTAEEIEAMKPVFGDSVDYSKVRIVTGANMGLWGRILTSGNAAVTWGKTIYFPNGADGKSQYSLDTKAYWLAHEMTHEYQYQKYGWGYVPSSVWGQLTKGQAFYEYQLEGGKGFRKYNVEQQADLVAHYYQILDGTRSATPAELAIYQQLMKDQGLFKGTGSN